LYLSSLIIRELFKFIRIDCGGDAYFLPAFLNPYNFTLALHSDVASRIGVFQHDGELYRLPGGKGSVRLEEYPGAAEVAGYAFAALEFDWQFALVTRRSAFFRFFHHHFSRFCRQSSSTNAGKQYAGGVYFYISLDIDRKGCWGEIQGLTR